MNLIKIIILQIVITIFVINFDLIGDSLANEFSLRTVNVIELQISIIFFIFGILFLSLKVSPDTQLLRQNLDVTRAWRRKYVDQKGLKLTGLVFIIIGLTFSFKAFIKVEIEKKECFASNVINRKNTLIGDRHINCEGINYNIKLGTRSLDDSSLKKGNCYMLYVSKIGRNIYNYEQIKCYQ